jgi:hypothetical protein
MPVDAGNVRIGIADSSTGGVYSGIIGTVLPTTATASLAGGFIQLGYISEEGVTQHVGQDTQTIVAWQGAAVVRKIQTSHELTYQFVMIETNDATLEEYYGNHAAGTSEITGDVLAHKSYVIEMADGTDLLRVVIPDGQPIDLADVVYRNNEVIGYGVTVSAYPDTNGVKAYVYQSGPDS